MSVRVKIISAFSLCALAGFAFLVWAVSKEVKPRFREALEETLVEQAYFLASVIEDGEGSDTFDLSILQEASRRTKSRVIDAQVYSLRKTSLDMRVYVTDASGKVLFHSHIPEAVGEDYSRWNDVYRTLRGSYGARSTRDVEDDPRTTVLYVAAPIMRNGNVVGSLTVGKPALHNNRFVLAAQNKIVLLGAFVAGVVVLFAVMVSVWLSTPLARLTEYVKALSAAPDASPPDTGASELNDLASLLHSLSSRLLSREELQRYIQALSHELKSPLSTIRGAIELLKEHELVAVDGHRMADNIEAESHRMEQLVQKLNELHALPEHYRQQTHEVILVSDLIKECSNSLKPTFAVKELVLKFEIGENAQEANIKANRALVELALSNVLQNAQEFSGKASSIEVTVTAGSDVAISVRDYGAGIPDWAIAKVCDPYFSLPRPDSGRKSSGLGLKLVQEIMAMHDGRLTIESEEKGTKVSLHFPTAT